MKQFDLTKWGVLAITIVSWLCYMVMSFYDFNQFQSQNVIGFLFLIIIPGFLTFLSIDIKKLNFVGSVSLAVGFSVLELMILGLLINAILPMFGVVEPLAKMPLMISVSVMVFSLLALCWFRMKKISISIRKYIFFDNLRDLVFSCIPSVFVILNILGAISLNNGFGNTLTMISLGGMSLYFCFLIYYAKKLDERTIPIALFFISLALLLMTSLRGWYITGHDIQSEYKVFQLAKNSNLWDVATYQDAYNACLSITILPTMFYNMLRVADPFIYKALFQVFFAFCPGLVYLISRHWTTKSISLVGTMFFIGFPTFFTDMPFLIRQEVAFLFYGLMLYLIFDENLSIRLRRWLFMIMGIGVVLSHYSTTYTILVVFGLAAVSRLIFIKILPYIKNKKWLDDSAFVQSVTDNQSKKGKVTIFMVVILLAASFAWTSLITDTGGHLQEVIRQTIGAIGNGFSDNNRSIDVATIISFSKPDQSQVLKGYIDKAVAEVRASAPSSEFFDEKTYNQYEYKVVGVETVPLTKIGRFLERHNVNTANMIYYLGQLLQKLMMLLVPIGMVYLLIKNNIVKYVDDELYFMALYCLIFIALNIILPVLSTAYGIFRAMQQSMFVIAPIIVIGGLVIGSMSKKLPKSINRVVTKDVFIVLLVIVFFSYSTYFIPYVFGGNKAVLHLSNAGSYYDSYLIKTTEIAGVEWLQNDAAKNNDDSTGIRLTVQADRYSKWKFASFTTLNASNDIFPGIIKRDSYVFLEPIVVTKNKATAIYNSDVVTYTYPIEFLEKNKDLIYNNGKSRVYK